MTAQQFIAYVLVLLMPISGGVFLTKPLWDGIHWLYVTPMIEPADFPALVLILLTMMEPRHALWVRRRPTFAGLILALAALGLLSVFGARSHTLAVYFSLRWVAAAGVCWGLVEADLKPQRVLAVFVAGLCVQSMVAIGQAVYQGPLGLPGELAPLPNAPLASIIDLGSRQWLRAYGLTFHPNVLGGFLAAGLITSLPLLSNPLVCLAWWLMSVALLASFSRSAGLAAVLVLPIVTIWLWRHEAQLRRGLTITLAVGAAAILLAGWTWRGPFLTRLRVAPDTATSGLETRSSKATGSKRPDDRLQLDAVAIHLMATHPIFGIGAGNSPMTMQAANVQPHYPHNVTLMLGAEVGIAGALLWLALFGLALRRVRQTPTTAAKQWAVAALGAFVALQIIGAVDCFPWSLNAGRMLTVTLLALIETTTRPPFATSSPRT